MFERWSFVCGDKSVIEKDFREGFVCVGNKEGFELGLVEVKI